MKQKKQHQKRTKKLGRKKNFRRKVGKISKISFKKIKSIIINKQIKQLKGVKLLPKKKINRIINKQINLLQKLNPRNLADFTSQSLNKFYEDFKKKQKITKLKKIKLEKKEKNIKNKF